MPTTDITVDTNVLMHADDQRQALRQAARDLISEILESEIHLCVDKGFDISFARNQSHIGAEYLEFLRFGSLGLHLVVYLASNLRITQHPRRTQDRRDRIIRRLVLDPSDRKFVAVACHSLSHILYSHDDQHFSAQTRKKVADELSVRILKANQR